MSNVRSSKSGLMTSLMLLKVRANDITDGAKKHAIFLSSCGDAAYRRIKDVLSPSGPAEVSFDDICTIHDNAFAAATLGNHATFSLQHQIQVTS